MSPIFSSAEPGPQLTWTAIWRNIYDPKQVFFICEVGDVAKAKAFVKSETERLKESGVSEFPDIYYLREG